MAVADTLHSAPGRAPMLSIRQVRARLSLSDASVRRLIKLGHLRASIFGGVYRITEEAIQQFITAAEVVPDVPRQAAVSRVFDADDELDPVENPFL